ncbi:hypothetical protein C8R44DRAFT_817764 [Mycena epipterygia]|nr:hypothetical protein C8R44DRAFT_817764 [Mycena epipterygia]
MTEYDYSEEGRRRYIATQNRIAKWVDHTDSVPQLKSPFSPRSSTGSDATARPHQYGPSRAGSGSRRPPTMQFSRGPSTHQTYRPSQAGTRPPPSGLRSQIYPPPSQGGGSRPPASTVYPSQSISQAPMHSQHSAPTHSSQSHRSSSASSHHSRHTHHQHRPSTYVISPPPSPSHGNGPQGVIIFPRRRKAPTVVYY